MNQTAKLNTFCVNDQHGNDWHTSGYISTLPALVLWRTSFLVTALSIYCNTFETRYVLGKKSGNKGEWFVSEHLTP